MTDAPTAGVAYLVSQYPALSHTFIETEVAAVRELGVPVHTFSVRPWSSGDLRTDRAREEARRTSVLQSGAARTLPPATLALLRRSPRALFAGLRLALSAGPGTVRARVWQLLYLGEAVILWSRMSRLGLRHVHVHFANNSADVARLAVALGTAVDGPDAGWRWSLTMHGPTEFEDQIRFDLAAKAGSADTIACISDFCRSQLMRLLPPQSWAKLGLVRMGVDATRFHPADPAHRAPDSGNEPAPAEDRPLRVLTVGRLVPEKGAPVLVEAVARLRKAGIPVHLTVVGSGPLAERLAEQSRDLGVADSVELRGPVGQDDLPELYRRADVFCLPSFAEGLPVVLMEAMASAGAVVTTRIAGIPELVRDDATGLLVTPGRADLVADALSRLAGDPGLRSALGAAGREAVLRDHDALDNGRRLVALWNSTTSRPTSPVAAPATGHDLP